MSVNPNAPLSQAEISNAKIQHTAAPIIARLAENSGTTTPTATMNQNKETLSSKFSSFTARCSAALFGPPNPLAGKIVVLPSGTTPFLRKEATQIALAALPLSERIHVSTLSPNQMMLDGKVYNFKNPLT